MRKVKRDIPGAMRRPRGGHFAGAQRQRGTVLILVVTLLGILFVVGMTFLATTNFEADMVSVDETKVRQSAAVSLLADSVRSELRDSFIRSVGTPFDAGPIAQPMVRENDEGEQVRVGFKPTQPTFAEMPDVHPLISQVEPYYDFDARVYSFQYFTDSRVLFGDIPPDDWQLQAVAADNLPAAGDGAAVDADGDGIVDSIQVDIFNYGFDRNQFKETARQVNSENNASGSVFLSLRAIPHGAMVNLNYSHPSMVDNVLDRQAPYRHEPYYSPLLEEPSLRRRFMLAPQDVPLSSILGNPYAPRDPDWPGGGDLAMQLFPQGESVYGDDHRFWPYSVSVGEEFENWVAALDPNRAGLQGAADTYDRRHLVTTVGHDDLLARTNQVTISPRYQGMPEPTVDVRDRMLEINQENWDPDICAPLFEYVNYPQTIADGGDCDCPTDERCEFNLRKGRLMLSLPWLDEALAAAQQDNSIRFGPEQAQRLIHDTFVLLLQNARGPLWDVGWDHGDDAITSPVYYECDDDSDCQGGEVCVMTFTGEDGACYDADLIGDWEDEVFLGSMTKVDWEKFPYLSAEFTRKAWTAAALTANMIDFADYGEDRAEIPTRVPVRALDFDDYERDSGLGGVDRLPAPGGVIDLASASTVTKPAYVYGLERQPFITKVAAAVAEPTGGQPAMVTSRAIELFNPYDEDLNLLPDEDYFLVEFDPENVASTWNEVALPRQSYAMRAGEFTVFFSDEVDEDTKTLGLDEGAPAGHPGRFIRLPDLNKLTFKNNYVIYLVRQIDYDGDDPEAPTLIALDQFWVDGRDIADPLGYIGDGMGTAPPDLYLMARSVPRPDLEGRRRWTEAIPWTTEIKLEDQADAADRLANWCDPDITNEELRPVQVDFANAGTYAESFPTTGSLLLLMRYANRALPSRFDYPDDINKPLPLAFTASLYEPVRARILVYNWEEEPLTGLTSYQGLVLDPSAAIDNGRLPIFDPQYLHRSPPTSTPPGLPGELDTLPWGQLIFDYFTALPLDGYGPYDNPDDDPDWEPSDSAKPRVEQTGLRVHGRVNLNAAPWKVLAGVPMIPTKDLPYPFREKIAEYAFLPPDDDADRDKATPIGDSLAKALVAYREARELTNSYQAQGDDVWTTGDYGKDAAQTPGAGNSPAPQPTRAWNVNLPDMRRGTGFMSVGELASVRHPEATRDPTTGISYYRVDGGFVTGFAADEDFVGAAAILIAMGDWVSVRSNVFTLYGTLRGEIDEDLQETSVEVDSRALRFQETVNRMPTFLGESQPRRIGERVISGYLDTRDD
jgi:hypothetical protein